MFKVIKFDRLLKYEEGLKLQNRAFDLVRDGKYDGVLLVLEHKPVLTIGRDGGFDNLLISKQYLKENEIDIVEIKRGGNITFHGPGQIVAYPIFNLAMLNKDSHWYIDCVEDVVIKTLKEYDVEAGKKPKYRGVWVGNKKITAVGIQIRKWITMHGLAFNINIDKTYFNMINPCGITEFGVASLEDYKNDADIEDVKNVLIKNFERVFSIDLIEENENILEVK
jgi:lipoyl(octanoyl) transferase